MFHIGSHLPVCSSPGDGLPANANPSIPTRDAPSTIESAQDSIPTRDAPSTIASAPNSIPTRDAPSTIASAPNSIPTRDAPSTTESAQSRTPSRGASMNNQTIADIDLLNLGDDSTKLKSTNAISIMDSKTNDKAPTARPPLPRPPPLPPLLRRRLLLPRQPRHRFPHPLAQRLSCTEGHEAVRLRAESGINTWGNGSRRRLLRRRLPPPQRLDLVALPLAVRASSGTHRCSPACNASRGRVDAGRAKHSIKTL